MAAVLRKLVKHCHHVVADSKDVLIDLIDNPVRFDTTHSFIAADLDDYFNRIKIDSLVASLCTKLREVFGSNVRVVDFASKLVGIILKNKYVSIGGRILKKQSSLSIGEILATDAGNIHREVSFSHIIKTHVDQGLLRRYYTFVDDSLSIVSGSYDQINAFMAEVNSYDPEQFTWSYSTSSDSISFLDAQFVRAGYQLETFIYVKPSHRPQYLHALSDHPYSHKAGIFGSQCHRYHVINSTANGYYDEVKKLKGSLISRGYCVDNMDAPVYDNVSRMKYLMSFKQNRLHHDESVPSLRSLLVLKLPYSHITRYFPFKHFWDELCASFAHSTAWLSAFEGTIPVRAFTTSRNLFLLTYQQMFALQCANAGSRVG